jgi:type VI protein secretion system component VasF
MTTVRQAAPGSATRPPGVASREQRRRHRRRLAREQTLAVVFLVVAFAVTVVLLGLQWLHTGSPGGPGVITTPSAEVRFMLPMVSAG